MQVEDGTDEVEERTEAQGERGGAGGLRVEHAEQQQSKGGKKKFGRKKKGKKAKSADRDFDDFENPLATDDVQYAET